MILAHLIGGLGNQMFQYACARRLAHALNAPLKLDLSAFESYGLRRFALDALEISAPVASREEVASFRQRAEVRGGLWRGLRTWLLGDACTAVRERSFAFDPTILDLRGNVLLDGYWQSERYFADIAGIIRREFQVKGALDSVNAAYAERIASTDSVSIHVRRGDYVANSATNAVHGTCGLDYYHRAVAEIAGKVSQPHFFLFSDDPDWVRMNFQPGFAITVVDANGEAKPCEDMRLMSLCRHNIIANSSFSWWGAWLNANPGKIVITPERWFNGDSHDTRDLIPSGWTRL